MHVAVFLLGWRETGCRRMFAVLLSVSRTGPRIFAGLRDQVCSETQMDGSNFLLLHLFEEVAVLLWVEDFVELVQVQLGMVGAQIVLVFVVLMVSSSRGLMVFWWLSWSPCLLAVSPGLLVAHSPLGSHGLIVSRSHGLLVALMVSLSSRRFSWSVGCTFPHWFSGSHRLTVSWSSGGSHGLMSFSLPLMGNGQPRDQEKRREDKETMRATSRP